MGGEVCGAVQSEPSWAHTHVPCLVAGAKGGWPVVLGSWGLGTATTPVRGERGCLCQNMGGCCIEGERPLLVAGWLTVTKTRQIGLLGGRSRFQGGWIALWAIRHQAD